MTDRINETLVVGASGRVGRLLARAWGLAGQRPVLQHRGAGLGGAGPQVAWLPLEGGPLPGGSYAAMIVLAGVVRGDLALNAALAQACLQAADRAGIGRVLLASSAAVYGVNGGLPCREDTAPLPVNDYGRAKLAAEAVAATWRGRGLAVSCLRIGNVAGADALLANPAAQLQIDRFADGQGPLRSYIGPQTLARVLGDLLAQDLPPVLNLAAPDPVAMADLAQAAGRRWAWQAAPSAAGQRITLDCAAVAGLVAFQPAESTATEMVAQLRAIGGLP